MARPVTAAAVDLGATSGRVMLGRLEARQLRLESVARFANCPVELPDGLHWDLLHLYSSALDGLRLAVKGHSVDSIGIDSWAVDYGLLTGDRLAGLPYHYRDPRNAVGVDRVHARLPFEELYARNGLQFQPFNTLYQLMSESPIALGADRALLLPDLIAFWLTGVEATEETNASTTGLLDARSRDWDTSLMNRLGIPERLFPALVGSGATLGAFRSPVAAAVGATLPLVAVATHDTASAVVAVPMDPQRAAYISCGTWGLVGVELPAPVLTDEARAANFTNEGGVDGTTRFLKNVMGLWILTETLRDWTREGQPAELTQLIEAAARQPVPRALLDVNDPVFMPPGDMVARIEAWLRERELPIPDSQASMVRLIVESLASAFTTAVQMAARLSKVPVEFIHIVGGGCQNTLLCHLIADRSGIPVVAGPVEATAIGNLLIQARSMGAVGDLTDIRDIVTSSFTPVTYQSRSGR